MNLRWLKQEEEGSSSETDHSDDDVNTFFRKRHDKVLKKMDKVHFRVRMPTLRAMPNRKRAREAVAASPDTEDSNTTRVVACEAEVSKETNGDASNSGCGDREQDMLVNIQLLTQVGPNVNEAGKRVTLTVQGSNTIQHVKGQIQALEGIPPKQQRLSKPGRARRISESATLAGYGVQNEDLLHLLVRTCGGPGRVRPVQAASCTGLEEVD